MSVPSSGTEWVDQGGGKDSAITVKAHDTLSRPELEANGSQT